MYRRRRRAVCRIVVVLLVVLAAAPAALADAYEGFDYAVGPQRNRPLPELWGSTWDGGSGFVNGNEGMTPAGWTSAFQASIGAGSLADPTGTLAGTGNHLVTGTGPHRRLAHTIGEPGTELWVGWLQRQNQNSSGFAFHGLNFLLPTGPNSATATYFIGEPGSGPGDGTYVIGRAGDDANVVSSGVPAVANQTAFLVARFQFREGNDLATLYVNPTPGVLPTGGVTYSGLDQPVLNPPLGFSTGAVAPASFAFDELRVGDSYFEVAPAVPEPAAAAAAVLMLLAARRRR